ncbi:GGDEF domain-containing protein [Paenibacillus sp. A3]|uniref:GGDEF domain-containing protein n=1 Tax=Paenibacillus sp. A3 TaxID=1337054 RepID=UPI0006D5341D|nr:GGDEF domain-containing protein [Paenibacillus sp. A3]
MDFTALTHACTLIALSYMALKIRNLLVIERLQALAVPVLTGAASIVMMLLPLPGDSLFSDLKFAPIVMAGLRFGWVSSLLSTLLPAGYMLLEHKPNWAIEAVQGLLLPAIISSLFHRKEYDSGFFFIRMTDGWSVCAILTVVRLVSHVRLETAQTSLFWLSQLLMLVFSGLAIMALIYMFNDENKIWMMQRKLELEAKQDNLTRLPNLRGFMDIAKRTIRSRRIAIMMIDIDNFKRYNDTFGHLHGDQLLREAGQLLKTAVHEQDYIARYGGEEFIILSHTTDETQLSHYADWLRHNIEEHRFYGDSVAGTTISIGISISRMPGDELRRLIAEADEALYVSKQSGKNRYSFYRADQTQQKNA